MSDPVPETIATDATMPCEPRPPEKTVESAGGSRAARVETFAQDVDGPGATVAQASTPAGTLARDPTETVAAESRSPSPALTETFAIGGDPAPTVGQSVELGNDRAAGTADVGGAAIPSRFRILKRHARGGLGEVSLAHDRELDREVALKEIQDRYADRPESRRRFLVEAQITGSLDHPGIVPVYSLSRDEAGRPYYAMRFIRGEGMDVAIKAFHASKGKADSDHSLEFRQLLQRFVEVCNTIAFAHSRQVIHRDIKPANVMLGPYGETLVVDWGLAKRLGSAEGADGSERPSRGSESAPSTTETLPGSAMGTPSYMSPEQSLGQLDRLGPASDIYSLGATLYILLTGREPFGQGSLSQVLDRVRKGEFLLPRTVVPGVPPPLEAICLKAMAVRPEDRYPSARILAEEIEHWMADEPVAAYPEAWPQRLGRWGRHHRTWTRAGAAALLVVAIVAVVSAVMVSTARRHEQAARLREDRQRSLVEAARKARDDRLREMRTEGEDLFGQGQDALDHRDWRAARLQFAKILAMVRPEPDLADLAARADRLRAEAERALAAEEERRMVRETYDRFQALRDDALYHGTLSTGLDLAANLDATRTAAHAALALYGMDADSSTATIAPRSRLGTQEQQEVEDGGFELLLVLADAEGRSGPGDPRDRARRALKILDRAAGAGSATRSYHMARARYLEQLGDRRAAREESARADAVEPVRAVDLFLVGEQVYQQGSLDRGARAFEATLRARPDHFWAQYFLAVCHLKADPPRPAEAMAHLTACLSRRPDFPWVYLLRGYTYGELGESALAEADFRHALELSRDDGVRYGVLVNRGGMRFRQGKPDAAIADLVEAIRLKPGQYQAYANLGLAYAGLRRWGEAIEQLDLAIARAPEQAILYRNRALVNLNRDDLDAALRDFGEAIRLASGPSPSLASDQAHRGRILHRGKRYEEALAAFDAALKIRPDDREFARLRAEVLLALGRGQEAIRAYDRYLDPDGADPDAYRRRGFERARAADPAGAIADYTRALTLEPRSAMTRARRGWAYLGESSKLALHDFDEAIKLDPRDSDLYNGRGYARALLGDFSGAVADAEQALRLGGAGLELRARLALNYNAACIYAQAAASAAFNAEPDQRQALAKSYQDRAVALIRQSLERLPAAARKPFFQQALADPALDPIRTYPPFVELNRSQSP